MIYGILFALYNAMLQYDDCVIEVHVLKELNGDEESYDDDVVFTVFTINFRSDLFSQHLFFVASNFRDLKKL